MTDSEPAARPDAYELVMVVSCEDTDTMQRMRQAIESLLQNEGLEDESYLHVTHRRFIHKVKVNGQTYYNVEV